MDPNIQSIGDLLNCKKLLKGHKRLSNIHEGIMLVFLWVVWTFRNLKAHSSGVKPLSVLVYEVQSKSTFWFNARKRNGEPPRLADWCCDPVLECYTRLQSISRMYCFVLFLFLVCFFPFKVCIFQPLASFCFNVNLPFEKKIKLFNK